MSQIQKIFVAGNLERKPVVFKTANGEAFTFLILTTNRIFREKSLWKKDTRSCSVLVRGKEAEICEKYLEKGFPIAAEGFLEIAKEHQTTMVAEELHFLGLRTTPPSESASPAQENRGDPLT